VPERQSGDLRRPRDADGHNGGLSMGIINNAYAPPLVDNIVAHLADPDNPPSRRRRRWTHQGLDNKREAYYDDTIVYNWIGSNDSGGPGPGSFPGPPTPTASTPTCWTTPRSRTSPPTF
jgi:hypothetical protein